MQLKAKVGIGFNLENAVCNHGFFMMLPNQWDPSTKSLQRPLRLADGCSSVMVTISSQSPTIHRLSHAHLLIHVDDSSLITSLSENDKEVIQKQVVRMLRLTAKDEEDVKKFQEVHAEARSKGFGRLFRSPNLFEDIVKTTLLCYASWNRTLEMCQFLCELQAELQSGMHKNAYEPEKFASPSKKRARKINDFFRNIKRSKQETNKTLVTQTPKSTSNSSSSKGRSKPLGNFPSSKELAGLREDFLRERCHLGLRAIYIIQLANLVENGKLKLDEFEETQAYFDDTFYQKIGMKLMKLKGIGPFATANILMCLGDYRNTPIDSETLKHLHEVHGPIENCKHDKIEEVARQVYDKFAPYQSLAYWYEHVEYYEKKLGQKLRDLSPSSYYMVSGSYLSKTNI